MRPALPLVFEDRADLRAALDGDLAKGGAFVPCDDAPELQARIVVAVELRFAKERILLDADVVHVAASGVGVQFVDAPDSLAARFAALLQEGETAPGAAAVPASDDLFEDGDLFGDDAPAATDPSLSDDELQQLLDEAEPGAPDADRATVVAGAAPETAPPAPEGRFNPGTREIDAIDFEGAALPSEPELGRDGSLGPAEFDFQDEGDAVLELGEPGTGHRTRHDDE